MPATVTLATTTLAADLNASDTRVKFTSTAGMVHQTRAFVTGELMKIISVDAVSGWAIVVRGVDGSRAMAHVSGDTVYVGRADQFYYQAPIGRPDAAIPVSPYIDARNGLIYFAQGDTQPSNSANRWWQAQTNTRTSGPLGISTSTLDPTSST